MSSVVVKRAFRYRFYPTDAQAEQLVRTFGCVRKVYNLALAARAEAWTSGRRMTYAETSAMLTEWKRTEELAYLTEVSSVPLQQALRHLQGAYVAFWERRSGYPRFKSRKKSKSSAEYTRSAFTYREGRLTLAKMAEPLEISWSRALPDGQTPSTVTISRDAAGRWFVALLCDDPEIRPLPRAEQPAIGIDAGLSDLVVLSSGEKIANPRFERADRERLAKARREFARKQKGSKNRDKARIEVARIHARITDRRTDHLHKLTTRLVRDNQAIVIEDLSVRNMMKNHSLARAISDAAWFELRAQLEYKCAWYGRELITVDRFYPSSRLCSGCGNLKAVLPLAERVYRCERCALVLDRDVNAARNLLAAGLAASACGAGVRPQRSNPGGQPTTKQENHGATRGLPARKGGENAKRW